jgi:sulfide:quinone oxidoreductase
MTSLPTGIVSLGSHSLGKPLPRAGGFAHAQAHVVADTINADVTRKPAPAGFDGHGGCFIEAGVGRAAYGSGNFYGDPAPTVALHSLARRWHWGKASFEFRVMRRWL